MIEKIKKYFWKVDGMDYSDNPSGSKGVFKLVFGKQVIGILSYENNLWTFFYTEEFKSQKKISPIIDFPDLGKIYKSNQLWPFFATRIPSLNQPFQLKKIKKANAQKDDAVALLKIFGNETITNPFHLLPV